MFNKRENSDQDREPSATSNAPQRKDEPAQRPAASSNGQTASIGPSIHIDGELKGNEDLLIEGQVNGTVKLKNNKVTIGGRGKVKADVFANTITVEGHMTGDLYAAERIVVRKTASIEGNIYAPRVSLEEGARFKGSIEMDPEADALKQAFRGKVASATKPSEAQPAAKPEIAPEGRTNGAAAKAGAAG